MYITCTSHVRRMHITHMSHVHHMHIIHTSHVHHTYITCAHLHKADGAAANQMQEVLHACLRVGPVSWWQLDCPDLCLAESVPHSSSEDSAAPSPIQLWHHSHVCLALLLLLLLQALLQAPGSFVYACCPAATSLGYLSTAACTAAFRHVWQPSRPRMLPYMLLLHTPASEHLRHAQLAPGPPPSRLPACQPAG